MPQESTRDENGEEEMGCEVSVIPLSLSDADFCCFSPTLEVPIFLSVYECGP